MWLWSFYTDIMEAVLVRHTSVDVPPGVCYGRTDVPLKATFPQEATAVAAALPTPPFDAVYTCGNPACWKWISGRGRCGRGWRFPIPG